MSLRPWTILALSIFTLALPGCPTEGDDDDAVSGDDDDATAVEPKFGPEFVGGDRPARVVWADDYDGVTPTPLLILLHGYTATADLQDFYFQLSARVEEDDFLLLLPDGTIDSNGNTFWNARPDSAEAVDDVAYLDGLVEEMLDLWQVDPARVYFLGHSNGGYMSYRMACEVPEKIAGVLNFAGLSPYTDEDLCTPSMPVSMLHVHGTEDDSVPYDAVGGRLGAREAAALWAERAGCDAGAATAGDPIDLVNAIDGAETTVLDYQAGCAEGLSVSLWTIEDGGHLPYFNDNWNSGIVRWMLDHSR